MSFFLASVFDWLTQALGVERILMLPLQRIHALYLGEKFALACLLPVSLMGCVAALNRFLAGEFAWPKPRKAVKEPKRKKGFGLKHLAMLLLALLPGGLVGTVAVYALVGKEKWRSDALLMVGLSAVPALLLLLLRAGFFPWPELRDTVFLSGTLGLAFGLLQVCALVKLLREWWGEPEECVAWWPPLALCLQMLLLGAAGCNILL